MADNLLDRLSAHSKLRDVPREQIEWLMAHGDLQRYEAGRVMFQKGDPVESMWLVLSGHVAIYVDRGAGPRKMLEWRGGDLSGVLPYSRLQVSPGRVVAEEAGEVFHVPLEHFPEMIRECYHVTAACVHVMLDRARHFTSTDLHEEKMLSLGKLAAGLAHELNNPASAATRSADELTRSVKDLETTAVALGAAGLPPSGYDAIARLRRTHLAKPGQHTRTPIEQADWEDTVEEWLDSHDLPAQAADALADSSVTLEALESLAGELTDDQLRAVVSWFGAGQSARQLASDIEIATGRIYSLVAAVKGFTYMDQSAAPKPMDIERGLADTMTVLRAKANAKSIKMRLAFEPDLPAIIGFGGELNQVWSNLLDNALDALQKGGEVNVTVRRRGEHVVVCVTDNGPGIPEDVKPRIFDPFFTTKAPGSGTGLGLDIVRRLVQRIGGDIVIESEPGRTAFKVALPVPEPPVS